MHYSVQVICFYPCELFAKRILPSRPGIISISTPFLHSFLLVSISIIKTMSFTRMRSPRLCQFNSFQRVVSINTKDSKICPHNIEKASIVLQYLSEFGHNEDIINVQKKSLTESGQGSMLRCLLRHKIRESMFLISRCTLFRPKTYARLFL